MSVSIERRREVATIPLLGAIAFANAFGAVIVFPLAPFLAADLGVPLADVALASMCFAGAAGAGGFIGSLFLGRLDRRRAILALLGGFGAATLLAAVAPTFAWLLAARLIGGLFAGPLLAIVFSMAAEAVPADRRARAASVIVGSYGLALLLGLPATIAFVALEEGWRGSLIALAGLAFTLMAPAAIILPRSSDFELRAYGAAFHDLYRVLARPESLTGLALIAGASFATLLISPHIATFALKNAHVGEAGLMMAYLIGGGLALYSTRSVGWVMDRVGALPASIGVGATLTLLLLLAFVAPIPRALTPPLLGLVLAAQLARSTVAQASAVRIARPGDRVAYQCLAAACTSLFQAAGAGCSTLILSEQGDGRLTGIEWLAALSILLCWIAPALVMLLEKQMAARQNLCKK
ncbi:MFS transporter [Terrarubrum flagellatum]|uniref:MFS transporter n=1 Tax=Terrirubrum flagellatum TaxID=2895980 RepID=UPI0031453085